MDNYFKKLDPSEFHPTANAHLHDIDTHVYNSAWELETADAIKILSRGRDPAADEGTSSPPLPAAKIIDIRAEADFRNVSLHGAENLVFDSIKAGTPSPFDGVTVLESQWTEMKGRLSCGLEGGVIDQDKPVVTICYDGESAQVLTSILRAQGVKAYRIKGGMASLGPLAPLIAAAH